MGFTEKKFIDVILAFDLPSVNLQKKLVITFSSKSHCCQLIQKTVIITIKVSTFF